MNNDNEKNYGSIFFKMLLPSIIIFLVNNAVSIFVVQWQLVETLADYQSGSLWDIYTDWSNRIYTSDTNTMLSIMYAVICIVIFGYQYLKRYFDNSGNKLTFRGISDNTPVFIVGIIIFVVGLQYVSIFLMNTVAATFPSWLQEYEDLLEYAGFDSEMTVGMALYAIVLGPICEELAFRGVTFREARKIFPTWGAIVAQALLFAIFHGNMLQGTYTFVVGLAFGYIMYRYNNLLVTIILHMLYNLIGTFGSELLPLGGDTLISYFCWTLGSLIVAYVGLLLLQKAAPGVKIEDRTSDN